MRIPLMRHGFFRDDETRKQLANFVCSTERFSMGSHCANFERMFSKYQECDSSVFVSSGSSANLVLIQSLLNLGRLQKGDRIGVSAITWPTNIMPLFQLGLVPVLIDCELDTLNISTRLLRPHIENLRAVFITHVLGFCDDIEEIQQLCTETDTILIEDTCESLGSRVGARLLGNFGSASTFSMFVGHHLSTIEGGMICTNDRELAEMCIMVRAHGWDRSLPASSQERLRTKHAIDPFQALFTFYDLAYNTRPNEINGFLGEIQLPMLADTVTHRERVFHQFLEATRQNANILPLRCNHLSTVSNFAMPVVCHTASQCQLLKQRFIDGGVEIRPVVAGDMSSQPFYRRYGQATICPNASQVQTCGFYFPNNPSLAEEEVAYLCSLLLP